MLRSPFFAALFLLLTCTVLAAPRYTVHGVTADGRRVTVPPGVHRPWAKDMLTYPKPELPASLRAKHIGGEALCRIVLDVSSGTVRDVVIAKSSGYPELDASMRRTVRRWTFRPKTWREFEIHIGVWPPSSSTTRKA